MPSSPLYITRKQNTTKFESIFSNYRRSTTASISYVPVVCRDCLPTRNKQRSFITNTSTAQDDDVPYRDLEPPFIFSHYNFMGPQLDVALCKVLPADLAFFKIPLCKALLLTRQRKQLPWSLSWVMPWQ
jgi:hypothetical protein